jgi:hypothetical protein
MTAMSLSPERTLPRSAEVALPRVPVYHDPQSGDYPHPKLLVDLLARPSKVDLLPLELQLTTILAWLVDRSRPCALELLKAFVGPHDDLAEHPIGARTRVTLPPIPPGGPLYPDLSIDVGDQALQLLIEVKVDAAFHTHVLDEATTPQPDTYVLAWRRAVESSDHGEAAVRRVGTLSRAPAEAPTPDVNLADVHTRRAADISWHSVRDLIDRVARADGFGEHRVVAHEFVNVLGQRVLHPAGTEISDPVLAWGSELLAELLPTVAARVPGASLGNNVAPQLDYVGRYLRLDFGLETPIQLWVYVSTAAGRYNGGRTEAHLWLSERPDERAASEVRAQLTTAGFSDVTDLAGTALRRALPVKLIRASGEQGAEREVAIEWILRSLGQAGVAIDL